MDKSNTQYPVGTVIWHMCGRRNNGKVYWMPVPQCIQESTDKGFWLDTFPHPNWLPGNSWNNIGKNDFLSREECLEDWGNKPMIEDDSDPEQLDIKSNREDNGKLVLYLDNSVNKVTFLVNGKNFDPHRIKWHIDVETAKWTGCGNWLTLDEIRNLINELEPGRNVIEVREEMPLRGVIYQTGNYNDEFWYEHGTTKGYA